MFWLFSFVGDSLAHAVAPKAAPQAPSGSPFEAGFR
jgi:hypothetical protein